MPLYDNDGEEIFFSEPDQDTVEKFEKVCERVRNYFEVAKLIEDLEEDVYEALINLENMILRDEVDEDDFEAIVATVAEAISTNISLD